MERGNGNKGGGNENKGGGNEKMEGGRRKMEGGKLSWRFLGERKKMSKFFGNA